VKKNSLLLFSKKKCPAFRPGNKGGIDLGLPIPLARKRERASLRRATAYSQKKHFEQSQKEDSKSSLVLIKDYTEKKSKAG